VTRTSDVKICKYCGKEYPDEATVCELDANPLFAIKVATAASPSTFKMTWLDKKFANMSDGLVGGISWIIALPLGIIGVIACKHPTARKNAWIIFGWQIGLLGLALILVLLKIAGGK
jgi:hypothetical protein